jgi:hypothetical protein
MIPSAPPAAKSELRKFERRFKYGPTAADTNPY